MIASHCFCRAMLAAAAYMFAQASRRPPSLCVCVLYPAFFSLFSVVLRARARAPFREPSFFPRYYFALSAGSVRWSRARAPKRFACFVIRERAGVYVCNVMLRFLTRWQACVLWRSSAEVAHM